MRNKGVKMVISAAGMAICLLCGSCGGEKSGKTEEALRTAGNLLLEIAREVRQEQEQKVKGWNRAVKYAFGWAKED